MLFRRTIIVSKTMGLSNHITTYIKLSLVVINRCSTRTLIRTNFVRKAILTFQSRESLSSDGEGARGDCSSVSSSASEGDEQPPCDIGLLERLIRTHPVWFLPGIQRAGAFHLLQGKEEGVCIYLFIIFSHRLLRLTSGLCHFPALQLSLCVHTSL